MYNYGSFGPRVFLRKGEGEMLHGDQWVCEDCGTYNLTDVRIVCRGCGNARTGEELVIDALEASLAVSRLSPEQLRDEENAAKAKWN